MVQSVPAVSLNGLLANWIFTGHPVYPCATSEARRTHRVPTWLVALSLGVKAPTVDKVHP